jgi:septal ring factor EnvC (AmiA/AmiB activator)
MADNENETNTPNGTQRATQDALEKQVAQLKREISKINKTLADRAEEAASGWYESAADRTSRATQQLRTQAQTVSETVQQNPGTVSTAFVLGGIVGLLLGMMMVQPAERDHRRWY